MTHPTTTTTTSPYPNSALPVCLISISSPPRAATDMDHPVGIVNLAGWATWAAASDVSAQIKNRKYKKQAAQEYQVKRCPPYPRSLPPSLLVFLNFASLPSQGIVIARDSVFGFYFLLYLWKRVYWLCVGGVADTLKYNIYIYSWSVSVSAQILVITGA